jgi:hypothetical protein
MNQVLAKIKGKGQKTIFKLLSNESLYENIHFTNTAFVEYSPDHNLDEDAWFKIDDFSNQTYCIDLVKKDFDSKDYDDLHKSNFSNISYLCSYQSDDFYFQKITPALFIRKKMIAFGEVVTVKKHDNSLVINSLPDAIYFKNNDTLIFRNLATISSIFKGVDELYKEATNEEVNDFLDESFIELSNGYDVEKVSKPNRKRVALAMTTLSLMSDKDKKKMLSYIDEYCEQKLKFDKENHKFEIATDGELKLLLYGIEQRFYTTPIGEEKRLANSVQKI